MRDPPRPLVHDDGWADEDTGVSLARWRYPGLYYGRDGWITIEPDGMFTARHPDGWEQRESALEAAAECMRDYDLCAYECDEDE